jgi:hypothetical protein
MSLFKRPGCEQKRCHTVQLSGDLSVWAGEQFAYTPLDVDSTNTSKYRCSSTAIGAVRSARAGVKARCSFQQGFGDCSADQASRGRVLAGDQAAVNYQFGLPGIGCLEFGTFLA